MTLKDFFFSDWQPILRILVVGPLAYAALVVLLRASGKRTLAQFSSFDFIITVAIGATFGRVMTASTVSLAEAVTAFTVLIALQYLVAWIRIRSSRFAGLVTAQPSLLFYRGEPVTSALRSQRLTETDLLSAARQHRLGSLDEVEAIVLEADGTLSVVLPSSVGDGTALSPARRR